MKNKLNYIDPINLVDEAFHKKALELSKELILYTMGRFATQTEMIWEGAATNERELHLLKVKFEKNNRI